MIERIKKEFRDGRVFLEFAFIRASSHGLLFIVALIVAKLLSPEEFGAYSLSMMVVYFFAAFFMGAAQRPFVIYANEELKNTGKINKSLTTRLVFGFLSIVFYIALAVFFAKPFSQFASISIYQLAFLSLAYVGLGIRYFFEGLFLALNRRMINAWYMFLSSSVGLAYIALLVVFGKATLENIFLIFFVSPIIGSFFVYRSLTIQELFPLAFDKALFWKMFHYAKWVVLGSTSVYFVNWGDNLVLRHFVSLKEIGVYNLGYQIFKGTIMLTAIVKAYFLPYLSQNTENQKKIQSYLYRKRPKILALGVLGIVALYITVPAVFRVLYGPLYEGSIAVMRILFVGSFFALYQAFYATLFDSLKYYRFTQTADVGLVITNLALDYIFVSYMGFLGAAVATVITYIASSIAYEIYFRMRCKRETVSTL